MLRASNGNVPKYNAHTSALVFRLRRARGARSEALRQVRGRVEHRRHLLHPAVRLPALLRRERRQPVRPDPKGRVRVRLSLLGRHQPRGEGVHQAAHVRRRGEEAQLRGGAQTRMVRAQLLFPIFTFNLTCWPPDRVAAKPLQSVLEIKASLARVPGAAPAQTDGQTDISVCLVQQPKLDRLCLAWLAIKRKKPPGRRRRKKEREIPSPIL